jgi:hypothetical protein
MGAPFSGASGYPRAASTVVTAAPASVRSGDGGWPRATWYSASVSPEATSGSTAWVSGSPSRQLNSTTQGAPDRSTMRPAYSTPLNGEPRRRSSASTGS